tara:strand:+ start:4259 stop:5014 length:756 start_codon:yes stop_codon:yes gene_type:complete
MKKKNTIPKDMVFVLNQENAPLSFMLNSRNSSSNPLLYWDGEQNRALRYAKNQKSPFEDEQDGNFILEPIIFEDGSLVVPKTNPSLQQFLTCHPGFNKVFSLLDLEQEAQDDVDILTMEVDALIKAKELSLDMTLSVARVQLGLNVDKISTVEIKRDILVYARNYPEDFLIAIQDPNLSVQDTIAKCFNETILRLRNKNRDVYINLPSNKTKLMTLPIGEEKNYAVAAFLKSDDGLPTLKMLEDHLEKEFA